MKGYCTFFVRDLEADVSQGDLKESSEKVLCATS